MVAGSNLVVRSKPQVTRGFQELGRWTVRQNRSQSPSPCGDSTLTHERPSMRQTPLDDDHADFLDDAHWQPRTREVAVSALNRWARWCVAHGVTVRSAKDRDLHAYLDERKAAGIAS